MVFEKFYKYFFIKFEFEQNVIRILFFSRKKKLLSLETLKNEKNLTLLRRIAIRSLN